MAALAGVAWLGGSHAVIVTDSDVVFAEKPSLSFDNIYVDVRDWDAGDFLENKAVAQMLTKAGVTSAVDRLRRSFD
jgi:hypothetical protein